MREWIKRSNDVSVVAYVHGVRLGPTTCAQDVCDAFADAECGGGGMDCAGPDSKFAATEHAACRAALRKEVFGE